MAECQLTCNKRGLVKTTKFGFCLPIFANPGMLFFRTPNYKKLDWQGLKETTLYSEQLGYNSLFVADHVFLGNEGEIWECQALMAALGALTTTMEIASIHLCNNFRHPPLVAKYLATLDHITSGRVINFYDYGWREAEFNSYGVPFGSNDNERIEQMDEGIQIIQGMLQNPEFSFQGKYYQLERAIATPLPIRKIPLWMGEANNSLMVQSIARHADVFNSMPCSTKDFEQKIKTIRMACREVKRDFSQMGLSLETQVLIRENERDLCEALRNFKDLRQFNNSKDDDILAQLKATNPDLKNYDSIENLSEQFLIGTPEQVAEKIHVYKKMGVEHFMLWFMDYPEKHTLELFARKVMPQVR